MNKKKKKKLPKAVLWTADAMREAGGAAQGRDAPQPAGSNEAPGEHAPAPNSNSADNVIELTPKPAISEAAAAGAPPPSRAATSAQAMRRQARALAIVERHANYSAIGGVIPLPIVNVASVTAIIVRMVRALSQHYGVPFERDRARAIVVGLMGGFVPTGLAAVTASTLFYIVPGSNLFGLAVSSVAASACARNIGRMFVDHFENGATLFDIPVIDKNWKK
jgi:uncharacterized protein (DUF697 family)